MLLSPFQLTRLMYWSSEQTDGCTLRMVVREIDGKHQAGSAELLLFFFSSLIQIFTHWNLFILFSAHIYTIGIRYNPTIASTLIMFLSAFSLPSLSFHITSCLFVITHQMLPCCLSYFYCCFYSSFFPPLTSEQISYHHPFWSVFFDSPPLVLPLSSPQSSLFLFPPSVNAVIAVSGCIWTRERERERKRERGCRGGGVSYHLLQAG